MAWKLVFKSDKVATLANVRKAPDMEMKNEVLISACLIALELSS